MKSRILLTIATLAGAGLVATGIVRAKTSADTIDRPITTTTVTTTSDTNSGSTPEQLRGPGHRLQEMAEMLGMSVTDLKAKLDEGTPFYKIAAEKGLTYSKLMEKQQAAFENRLKDMVTSGFLTQEQADQFLANWKAKASDTGTLGFGMGMGRGHGRWF